jgi:GNAT superfamily N-acetyltransferase
MAVEEGFRGQGLGAALVRWCQQRALRSGDGIWCNARIRAVSMYARCGFEIVSDEFEIEKIGPHYRMEWKDGE